MSTCAAVSMAFQSNVGLILVKLYRKNYLRGVSCELKVQTSVLYDMVLERESTQPFLTRDEIDTIIGNICSNYFKKFILGNIFIMCLICVLYVRLNMIIIIIS